MDIKSKEIIKKTRKIISITVSVLGYIVIFLVLLSFLIIIVTYLTQEDYYDDSPEGLFKESIHENIEKFKVLAIESLIEVSSITDYSLYIVKLDNKLEKPEGRIRNIITNIHFDTSIKAIMIRTNGTIEYLN